MRFKSQQNKVQNGKVLSRIQLQQVTNKIEFDTKLEQSSSQRFIHNHDDDFAPVVNLIRFKS